MSTITDNTHDISYKTLTRFIIDEQIKHSGTGQLSQLMSAIQTACKAISSLVRKEGIAKLHRNEGPHAPTGITQEKLDDLSNQLFLNALNNSHSVCCMVSENNEQLIHIPLPKQGKYSVVFDPLDGSSNIDCLGPVGSIFGIYEYTKDADRAGSHEEHVLQPGRNFIAAGYTLYGSATVMVIAIKWSGVNGFTLDPSIGEFILTDPDMKIKEYGCIYSINEGNESISDKRIKDYINLLKYPKDGKGRYTSRYVGSLVSDIHRTLKSGGIFIYPANKEAPRGKLRLLYEASPIAFVLEMAGGSASDFYQSILDVCPTSIHCTTPVVLGTKFEVEKLLNYYLK
ncbi:hypothetical protein HZS_7151 [Henneguya salminicola]|nr:hypothetical protein HZS_7151 [Henneguya salminicola]